jgi:hypothetical protein
MRVTWHLFPLDMRKELCRPLIKTIVQSTLIHRRQLCRDTATNINHTGQESGGVYGSKITQYTPPSNEFLRHLRYMISGRRAIPVITMVLEVKDVDAHHTRCSPCVPGKDREVVECGGAAAVTLTK